MNTLEAYLDHRNKHYEIQHSLEGIIFYRTI